MTIDYSKVPGLTEEMIAGLTELHNKDVNNLIENRDSIKQEKLSVQEKLTAAEQIAEDARAAAAAAKEEALKAAGDITGLKALYEDQLATAKAEYTSAINERDKSILERDRGDALSQVLDMIHDDHKWVSKPMLSNMLEIGYNDQQQQVVSFKHEGNVVANNVDEFKSWANEQDSFKRILKGVDSSGAGTTQSQGGSAAVTNKPLSNKTQGYLANLK